MRAVDRSVGAAFCNLFRGFGSFPLQPSLEQAARLYREGGWPAEVQGDAFTAPFSAPSAGPPPWHVYRFTFHTAFGVAPRSRMAPPVSLFFA